MNHDSFDGGSAHLKVFTRTGQHNKENRIHTSMPRLGFEPTIVVFERSKTTGTDIPVSNWLSVALVMTAATSILSVISLHLQYLFGRP